MECYQYKNYNDLLNDISNGEYVINQPINHNGEKMSFLNKLLEFTNIDKYNLHKIFEDIMNRIKYSLLKERKKTPVYKLLKHVKNEWDDNEKVLFCENGKCVTNIGDYLQKSENSDEFIKNIENKMSEKKVFSKFLQEDEMDEYSEIELMNLAEESLKVCEKILSEMNADLVSINDEYQKLDSIDLNFILDLSLKHIELYECFNEGQKESINKKIHNIFLNYALMINLLKKQYLHMRKIILEIKSKMNEKCNFIKDNKNMFSKNLSNVENQDFNFF